MVGVQRRDGGLLPHQPARTQPAELGRAGQQVEQRDVIRAGLGRWLRQLAGAGRQQQSATIRAGDVPASRHCDDAMAGSQGETRSPFEALPGGDLKLSVDADPAGRPVDSRGPGQHAGGAAAAGQRPAAGAAGADHEYVHCPAR